MARDTVDDRIRGLDAGGAVDYLTKPFDLDELCARMRGLCNDILNPRAKASLIIAILSILLHI